VQESRDPATAWLPALAALGENGGTGHWCGVPGVRWGSGLWVRNGTLTPLPVPDAFTGWLTGALVAGPTWPGLGAVPLAIWSVHGPTRKPSSNYVAEIHRILDYLDATWPGQPVVLAGDFNSVTGRRGPDEPVRCSKHEYRLLDRLIDDCGLIPCWQTAHPGEPLARTLRWPRRPDSLPYHCDGIFVPAPWAAALQACEVLEDTAWMARSDHNPVIATFG
jgi:endonuclease/exonuclease/phosphatase family metal-dependent hydrolase